LVFELGKKERIAAPDQFGDAIAGEKPSTICRGVNTPNQPFLVPNDYTRTWSEDHFCPSGFGKSKRAEHSIFDDIKAPLAKEQSNPRSSIFQAIAVRTTSSI
jgi:hypothetical protein